MESKKIIVVSSLIEKDTMCCSEPNIHKAHFVTRGFEQVNRCDYTKPLLMLSSGRCYKFAWL